MNAPDNIEEIFHDYIKMHCKIQALRAILLDEEVEAARMVAESGNLSTREYRPALSANQIRTLFDWNDKNEEADEILKSVQENPSEHHKVVFANLKEEK
jgi:hypothetical protein